jgi:hypothetical protein
MSNLERNFVDNESKCWTASMDSTGTDSALWAIAASMCKLAAAMDRLAQNFGPEADVAAPTRAVETLAAAVDNIAGAVGIPPDGSGRDGGHHRH